MKIPVYTIDTGVPVKDRNTSPPLMQLEVGQSVLFPLQKRMSVQTTASKIKKETGKKFVIRKMDDDNARVWRTE